MPSLPTGTVTFLFTDIEGSTTLLQRLGDRRYAEVLAEHQRLLRDAIVKGHGKEINTQGDAFLVAFGRARDALAAAVAAQQALTKHPWPDAVSLQVRMGLHTGEPLSGGRSYVGIDVHRAARIAAAGHGGQILLSDAVSGLAARDLPPGVSLRDLGAHRLKDLREPEHLLQVVHPDLPSEFPPLKSLDVIPNNLPRQLTTFIGRDREIAQVKRLLAAAYLVTLTGTGGVGKTRLALQVATDLLDQYSDGVWVADLAPLSDPVLVPKTVASALNVPEQLGRPPNETLASNLRPKHLLLLLDNCEHVLSTCRDLTDVLLRACPRLRILATSREALGVDGESTYRVPSLQLPHPQHLPAIGRLAEYEAVRLFFERAALSQPSFALTAGNATAVAQICHRLDGIPLAIEFAAARVKVLSVDQIAARLDDRFRLLTAGNRTTLLRHQTLRATMDWSYDLLSDQGRTVLCRLSVFSGGWTLEAVEGVCSGNSVDASDVLNVLTQLVDKSLVVAETRGGEARYRLLETVRQYCRDRLQESGEAANVRQRHRDWYLELAEHAAPELRGANQGMWLERLETEHDNLRAALEWSKSEETGIESELRMAAALRDLWYVHGHWHEGRRCLEEALARCGNTLSPSLPKVLEGLTSIAWRQGDDARAAILSQKGLDVCQRLGDRHGCALFFLNLGIAASVRGDTGQAMALFSDSLTLCHEVGDDWLKSAVFTQFGAMARERRDYERAMEHYATSLDLSRKVGDRYRIAYCLRNLGIAALYQGAFSEAAAFYAEGLTLSRELRSVWVTEECLEGLASVACAERRYKRAAYLFGIAEELREMLGYNRSSADRRAHDQRMASARAALGDAAFDAAWAEGRAMTLEQAIEYALAAETR